MAEAKIDIPDFIEKSMINIAPSGCYIMNSAGDGYVALVSHNEYDILERGYTNPINVLNEINDNVIIKEDAGKKPINRNIGRVCVSPGEYFPDKLNSFYDGHEEYSWTMGIMPFSKKIPELVFDKKHKLLKFPITVKDEDVSDDEDEDEDDDDDGAESKNSQDEDEDDEDDEDDDDDERYDSSWLKKYKVSFIDNNNLKYVNCADVDKRKEGDDSDPNPDFVWSTNYEDLDYEEFQEKDTDDDNTALWGSFFLDWKNIKVKFKNSKNKVEEKTLFECVSTEGKKVINIFENPLQGSGSAPTLSNGEHLLLWRRALGFKRKDNNACEYFLQNFDKTEGIAIGFKNNTFGDRLGRIVQMVFIFNQDKFWKWKSNVISRINYGFSIYQLYLSILGNYEQSILLKANKKLKKVNFAIRQSTINKLFCENTCDFSFQPFFLKERNKRIIWEGSSRYYIIVKRLSRELNGKSFKTTTIDIKSTEFQHILWVLISHGTIISNLAEPLVDSKTRTKSKSKSNDFKVNANYTFDKLANYSNSLKYNSTTDLTDKHIFLILNCTPFTLYYNLPNGFKYHGNHDAIPQKKMQQQSSDIIAKYNYHRYLLNLLYERALRNFGNTTKYLLRRSEKQKQLVMIDELPRDPNNIINIRRNLVKSKGAYLEPVYPHKTVRVLLEEHDAEEIPKKKKKFRKEIVKKLKAQGIVNIKSYFQEICDVKKKKSKSKRSAATKEYTDVTVMGKTGKKKKTHKKKKKRKKKKTQKKSKIQKLVNYIKGKIKKKKSKKKKKESNRTRKNKR
jgi:hypothetical protein